MRGLPNFSAMWRVAALCVAIFGISRSAFTEEVSPATANGSMVVLSRKAIESSVQKKLISDALEMARAGAFQGFKASPGSSMAPSAPLYDFLVQNVAVDANDRLTGENPLTAARQRDIRVGEALSYFMCDYPRNSAGDSPSSRQHRYAVPFAQGTDQTGAVYPIILGMREMTPTAASSEFGTLGPRDIASMVGIFPGFGCYMGAYIPKKEGYVVSLGPGYADDAAEGMARFAHPLYPNPVPAPGSMWYATVLQKTFSIGASKAVDTFAAHRKGMLVPQLTIGKRLMYTYGTRDIKVGPLDTVLVVLAYNNVNSAGDAPQIDNRSAQTERIYLTKELGYATRWESWAREHSGKDVIETAQKAYAYNDCGKPADLSGQFSEHMILGPVIEDKELGVYKQQQTFIDPESGKSETAMWYMVGCHDYTNLKPQAPVDPSTIVNPANLSPSFMRLFGARQ